MSEKWVVVVVVVVAAAGLWVGNCKEASMKQLLKLLADSQA